MNHLCQDCNRVATHANPLVLCDRCWARRNSTQSYNGKEMPYREFFLSTMPKGMERQPDETKEEWHIRCQTHIQGGGYARGVIKSKGKKMATEDRDDDP